MSDLPTSTRASKRYLAMQYPTYYPSSASGRLQILFAAILTLYVVPIFAQDTTLQLTLSDGATRTVSVKGAGRNAVFNKLYCLDGTTFKNVTISSISDEALGIIHEDGVGAIPWSIIPKELYPILQYRQADVDKRKAIKAAEIEQARQDQAATTAALYRPKVDDQAKKEYEAFKFNRLSPGKTTWKLVVVEVDTSEHKRSLEQFARGNRTLFFSKTKVLCKLYGTTSHFVYLPTTFGSAKDSESDVVTGEVIAVTGEPTSVEDEGYVRFSPERIKGLGYVSE